MSHVVEKTRDFERLIGRMYKTIILPVVLYGRELGLLH
jgi:hypothetical protein